MDDAAAMGFVQPVRNLRPALQPLLQRQRSFLQTLRQRLSFYALHHQIVDAVLRAHVVQSADVRMIQAGNGLRFTLESLLANRIRG